MPVWLSVLSDAASCLQWSTSVRYWVPLSANGAWALFGQAEFISMGCMQVLLHQRNETEAWDEAGVLGTMHYWPENAHARERPLGPRSVKGKLSMEAEWEHRGIDRYWKTEREKEKNNRNNSALVKLWPLCSNLLSIIAIMEMKRCPEVIIWNLQ